MPTIAPPPLSTLTTHPSWHNRSGRTDRSACVELRPRDVLTTNKPGRSEAQSRVSLLSNITLTARRLARIHNTRLPYQLKGDRRTTKSNAMRTRFTKPRDRCHSRLHESMYNFGNPNKGAPRTKFLGLWADWSQSIRLERRTRKRTTPRHNRRASPPTYSHQFICPICERRVMKLFLPLCTRAEATDADTAEQWINSLDAHYAAMRKPLPPDSMHTRAMLIQRYGPLFRPDRELRCRHCWHIRYGESKRNSA